MSTLVDELEQAAKRAEDVAQAAMSYDRGTPDDAAEPAAEAARLRKRVEHIKRLRDECQSMADAHLFYALTGDL